MILDIDVHLDYALPGACDFLLQIEAAEIVRRQRIVKTSLSNSKTDHFARVPGEDWIGGRVWLRAQDRFQCDYSARIEITRPQSRLEEAKAMPVHLLDGDKVKYLFPSRYCQADEMLNFVDQEFAELEDGPRLLAMRDWIANHFEYVPGVSNAQTTALDTFIQRQGVCRDYAHVMITMARASAIPARIASVYAPNVSPQDFHAVAEVWLEDGWHLIDPTGMAKSEDIAIIGVGRDAADVSFLTTYGMATMNKQSVSVSRVE